MRVRRGSGAAGWVAAGVVCGCLWAGAAAAAEDESRLRLRCPGEKLEPSSGIPYEDILWVATDGGEVDRPSRLELRHHGTDFSTYVAALGGPLRGLPTQCESLRLAQHVGISGHDLLLVVPKIHLASLRPHRDGVRLLDGAYLLEQQKFLASEARWKELAQLWKRVRSYLHHDAAQPLIARLLQDLREEHREEDLGRVLAAAREEGVAVDRAEIWEGSSLEPPSVASRPVAPAELETGEAEKGEQATRSRTRSSEPRGTGEPMREPVQVEGRATPPVETRNGEQQAPSPSPPPPRQPAVEQEEVLPAPPPVSTPVPSETSRPSPETQRAPAARQLDEPPGSASELRHLLERLEATYQRSDYGAAEHLLGWAREIAPDDPRLFFYEGLIALGRKQYEAALGPLHRAKGDGPDEVDFYIAWAYFKIGAEIAARDALARYLQHRGRPGGEASSTVDERATRLWEQLNSSPSPPPPPPPPPTARRAEPPPPEPACLPSEPGESHPLPLVEAATEDTHRAFSNPLVLHGHETEDLPVGELAGKPLLLHLWASWCGPCREEMPEIVRFYERCYPSLEENGLELVMLSVDTERHDLARYVEKALGDGPFRIHWDPEWKLARRLGVADAALPKTILIDRTGAVDTVLLGRFDWHSAEFLDRLEGLLASKEVTPRPASQPATDSDSDSEGRE